MPIKDYNTDPEFNTTISGINIAEGCAPSGINNAIRQLMADVKEHSTEVETFLEEKVGTIREDTLAAARQATASGGGGEAGNVTLEGLAQAVDRLDVLAEALGAEVAGKADVEVDGKGVVRSVNGVEADAAGDVALKAVITETWVSGTSWYRKWSDGWVEQGGQVSATANSLTTVTLHTAMGASNYTMLLTHYGESLEDSHPFKAGNRTTSSFRIANTQSQAITVGWLVTGK